MSTLSGMSRADYQQLEHLLATQQWQSADLCTRSLMLQIAHLAPEDLLLETSLQHFPCNDLQTLDRLWATYSEGRFGFRTQRHIWRQVGGEKQHADYNTWLCFGDRVGWLADSWLDWSNLCFHLHAPPGHLPVAWLEEVELGDICVCLFDRLGHCGL